MLQSLPERETGLARKEVPELRRPCVYKHLAMTMFEQNISIAELAARTYIDYKALCRKLNGETKVTIEEAISIHEILNRALPIELLFKRG